MRILPSRIIFLVRRKERSQTNSIRSSAGRRTEKAVLLVIGIYIKSHDFAFRVDRVDLGVGFRSEVNCREIAVPTPHEAVKTIVIPVNSYNRAGVVDSFRDRKSASGTSIVVNSPFRLRTKPCIPCIIWGSRDGPT
jgi:hypothetical protein